MIVAAYLSVKTDQNYLNSDKRDSVSPHFIMWISILKLVLDNKRLSQ